MEPTSPPVTIVAADRFSATTIPDDVRLARGGDQIAFERLYRANVGRVFALCLRMVGDRSRAEELAQDVFVRVWEVLASFRGESAFTSWLHRLTVNHVLMSIRSDKRRLQRVRIEEDLSTVETIGTQESLPDKMDIDAALPQLPEQARIIFVLHDIEGYRHEEIAGLLGLAEGTSKSQLHRARMLLRNLLVR